MKKMKVTKSEFLGHVLRSFHGNCGVSTVVKITETPSTVVWEIEGTIFNVKEIVDLMNIHINIGYLKDMTFFPMESGFDHVRDVKCNFNFDENGNLKVNGEISIKKSTISLVIQ